MNAEEPSTLAGALAAVWRRQPERPALVCRRHRLTYADLARATHRLAGTYHRLGVRPGDRVVCSLANRCELVVAMAAAWTYGAVHVALEHRSTAAEISGVLERTGAGVLVHEPSADAAAPLAPLDVLRRRHPGLRVVVVSDHLLPSDYLRWDLTARDAPAGQPGAPPPSPDDPAIVFISSGTTGTPKATVGFHGNLSRRWRRLAGWLRFGADDVHLAQLPLSHGFGLMMTVAALLGGGRVVLLDRFSPDDALRTIGAEGVTVLNGAPAHFRLLLDRLDPLRHRVDPLRFAVGTAAPFPPRLVNQIWERLGVEFMVMYGSSEGVGVATTDSEDILRGAVGRPEPGSVAVVGPDRAPLPVGDVGEVAFSRAVYPVRYWTRGDEAVPPRPPGAATAPWYYSGDLGRLDGDGRLYILGRLKHLIDRGGLKVDPTEVELALLRCAGVADAAVIGQPHDVLGETVCACVVPAPGRRLGLGQLRAELATTLAPPKLPEELRLLDRIPRTAMGKVDMQRLREAVDAAPADRLARR